MKADQDAMRDLFALLVFAAPLGLILLALAIFLRQRRRRLVVTGIVLMIGGLVAFGALLLFDAKFWHLNFIQ